MNRSTLIGPSRGPAASGASNPWQVHRDDYGVVWLTNQPQPRIEPSDWRQRMTDALQSWFGVVAVGAKRLSSEGRVFSMGEFVIHPKGIHHLGQGTPAAAIRFPEEADAIAGGVRAVEAHAADQGIH